MRALILVPSFAKTSPVMGGYLLARHLRSCGDSTWFGALSSLVPADQSLLRQAVRDGIATPSFGMHGWSHLRHWRRVQKFVRGSNIDVVVSYCIRPDLVASWLSAPARVCYVRDQFREQYLLTQGRLRGHLAAALHLRALRRCDAVLVLTQEIKDRLRAEGLNPDSMRLVPNFVDVSEVQARASDSAADAPPLPTADLQLGYFGPLVGMKRLDRIIRALAILENRHGFRAGFHVVGDGPERESLSELAVRLGVADRIRFHGYLEEPLGVMHQVDAVVLASESEGTPRSFMEAMALGKTCIGPDLRGLRELIDDGRTGLIFDGSDQGLAEVLSRIATPQGLLDPAAVENHVRSSHDVGAGAERARGIICELLGAPAHSASSAASRSV